MAPQRTWGPIYPESGREMMSCLYDHKPFAIRSIRSDTGRLFPWKKMASKADFDSMKQEVASSLSEIDIYVDLEIDDRSTIEEIPAPSQQAIVIRNYFQEDVRVLQNQIEKSNSLCVSSHMEAGKKSSLSLSAQLGVEADVHTVKKMAFDECLAKGDNSPRSFREAEDIAQENGIQLQQGGRGRFVISAKLEPDISDSNSNKIGSEDSLQVQEVAQEDLKETGIQTGNSDILILSPKLEIVLDDDSSEENVMNECVHEGEILRVDQNEANVQGGEGKIQVENIDKLSISPQQNLDRSDIIFQRNSFKECVNLGKSLGGSILEHPEAEVKCHWPEWGDPLPPESDEDDLPEAPQSVRGPVTSSDVVTIVRTNEEREEEAPGKLVSGDCPYQTIESCSTKDTDGPLSETPNPSDLAELANQLLEMGGNQICGGTGRHDKESGSSLSEKGTRGQVKDSGSPVPERPFDARLRLENLSGQVAEIYAALPQLSILPREGGGIWSVKLSRDRNRLAMKRLPSDPNIDFRFRVYDVVDDEKEALRRPPWKRKYRAMSNLCRA